jgi:hypothetical protein
VPDAIMVADTTDIAMVAAAVAAIGMDQCPWLPDRDRVVFGLAGITARQVGRLAAALPPGLRLVFATEGIPHAHDILDAWPAERRLTVVASDDFYHEVLATDGTGLPTGFQHERLRAGFGVWFRRYGTPRPGAPGSFEYDVVISFAGKDREVARTIRDVIAAEGYRVFYDYENQHALLGENLAQFLHDVFFRRGRYAVVVVSKAFTESLWASNWEWHAVLARMQSQRETYLLPYLLDDTEVPGLNPTVGYVTRDQCPPREFGRLVVRKLAAEQS